MISSLDTLSSTGFELTAEQLDDIDGGFVMVAIAVLALVDGVMWGYILNH